MDSFNKVISFVLGLVVVVVFFAVITGKLKIGKFKLPAIGKATVTVTPSPSPTSISTVTISNGSTGKTGSFNPNSSNNYKSYNVVSTVGKNTSSASQIPSTGLPTIFIPSLLAGALGGNFLRKTGKKK